MNYLFYKNNQNTNLIVKKGANKFRSFERWKFQEHLIFNILFIAFMNINIIPIIIIINMIFIFIFTAREEKFI